MTRRDVVIDALEFRPPAYVPWEWEATIDCERKLKDYLGTDDLTEFYGRHFIGFTSSGHRWEDLGDGKVRDIYGVVWDRSIDKDIGTPCDWPIKKPSDLDSYDWPKTDTPDWYAHIAPQIEANRHLFSVYYVGFSLFERAWTMRGMPDLLMDMVERPEFVDEFLTQIVDNNLHQVRHALEAGVDAVYFGDDYGMQRGLIMGITHWRRFIKPQLARMFAPVREAGRYVTMHSCGRVAELFDDLVEIGLQLFNPFQPEVTDIFEMKRKYHGRLAFHGGMSIQRVLPFGSVSEVREMTHRLIDAGREGGYIFSPSHAVPRDVPPENLVAMVEVLKSQEGYAAG